MRTFLYSEKIIKISRLHYCERNTAARQNFMKPIIFMIPGDDEISTTLFQTQSQVHYILISIFAAHSNDMLAQSVRL